MTGGEGPLTTGFIPFTTKPESFYRVGSDFRLKHKRKTFSL